MADIALKPSTIGQTSNNFQTIDVVGLTVEQDTGIAGEAIKCGAPVYIDPTTGRLLESDANVAARQKFYGFASHKAAVGESLTVYNRAVVAGYDLSAVPYGAPIFISDTQGVLSDTAGTLSIKVGEVIPIYGQTRGNSPMKAIRIRGVI